jgi:RNA polymerase sigma-70 factor, ECF subfamily
MSTPEQDGEAFVPDNALADRARIGDGTAFAALVVRHRDAAYTIARNMSATFRGCEEVLHQAFLTAWRDLSSLPAGARFETWLYGITMKIALAHRQSDRRCPPCALEMGRWSVLEGRSSEPDELARLLRAALESIDDRMRAAFVLRDLLLLPAEEAAVILQTSVPAVRRDVHRARLFFRGIIDSL